MVITVYHHDDHWVPQTATLAPGAAAVHMCPVRLAIQCTFDAAAAGANTAFKVCFHATAAIIVNVPKWAERNPQQAAKR
jgi:hypothetical protein